jgi:uncharacterized protein YjbI with pentapeptide repeats
MNSAVVAAVIAASVSVLTLIGTLTAQYLGRRATRRDLDRTLTEQQTRTMNERFATAADKLGSDKPPAVRLAGVYAMAGLADDWPANRQTCVDVLCAYLRLPYAPDPGGDASAREQLDFRASREVRQTVIRVITDHLKHNDEAAVSWHGLNLDFTGAVFDGGSFDRAQFCCGAVSFNRAQFSGEVSFRRAQFSGSTVNFDSAQFSGEVGFRRAQFSGSTVNFDSAQFSGGEVDFSLAEFSAGKVYFNGTKFSGGTVSFSSAQFSGAKVDFAATQFSGSTVELGAKYSGGEVTFNSQFSGGEVSFSHAQFSGSTVSFSFAEFSGSVISFDNAKFSRGTVSFMAAKFSGGTIDLSGASDWSFPPKVPWTDKPPPGVKVQESTGATDVGSGTVAASNLTVASDTDLTGTSPPTAAGTVGVTVTTPATPGPEVTGINPPYGSMAGGDTVTVTGRGFTGATDVGFGTVAASNLAVASDTDLTVTSPPAPAGTVVDVTVTTPAGTSPTTPAALFFYR